MNSAGIEQSAEHGSQRFIVDVHLGKLAFHLRLLGFDALYRSDYTDQELIRISNDELRTLLTKDRRMLEENHAPHSYYVRSSRPREQLLEVLRWFNLFNVVAPFRRCLRCNALLESVEKSAVIDRLPRRVARYFDEFQRCPVCNRIFWKGSHYERMEKFISSILQQRISQTGNEFNGGTNDRSTKTEHDSSNESDPRSRGLG